MAGSTQGNASSAFHAEVKATGESDSEGPTSPLRARVTLELKGEALEYRMQLRNPGAELVTEAVVTMRGEGDAPATTVVQLFADAGFRSSILELRGMATVRASMKAPVVAEELSSAPHRFTVVLRGQGRRDVWSGPLRVGR